MTLPRLSLPLAAALLWTGAVATVPARGSETQLTAVLSLAGRPGDGARLHRLASGRPAPAALRALRPAPAHRTAALWYVRSRHLTVVRSDAWSVTVRGPARDVARAFGATLRSAGATGATGATGAEVPAELRADVRSVAGLDNRRVHQPHALRPHATAEGEGNPQTAASLRTQYDLPTSWRGSGVTVGVLNLAGWNAGDLQAFADREGIPVSPGQVTDVAVGADPAELDGFGSEYEVALDAEAVLGAAPEAKQRLYFAPNTSAGIVSGLQQMAADAEAGLLQVATTSWGSCERDFDLLTTEADREAYRAAIDRMVAAGVTFFAASGDAGAFDCGYPGAPDDEAQVDFPASYPNTVGVGGTTLNAGQPETAWSDQGYDGYLGDGSGGGESVEQPLPAYQAGRLPAAMRRLVPDVSADADP